MSETFQIEVNGEWTLAHAAREARGFFTRGWGWMLRSRPPEGEALVFRSCSSLHTVGMRFPLDIVFLDADLRVLGVRPRMGAWRVALGPRGTRWSLEMPAGARAGRLREGDTLAFRTIQNR